MTQPSLARQLLDALVGRWRVLLGVLPGVALAMLHSTALDLPRGDVIQALDTDRYRIQWIMGSYLLGGAAGMALTRYCGARFGLRGSYLAALLLFTLSATLCGAVSEIVWMTPLRLLQGLGMGLLISSGMVILWREFPEHRELAMALYGLAVYVPALAGATVGGLLTVWDSWRWIFLSNLPLGLMAFALAWRLLDAEEEPLQPVRLDLVGFLLHLGWIVTLSVVLDMGQYWGWLHSPAFVPWFAGFVLSFAAFVAWGLWAPAPLIDLRPCGLRNFALGIGIKVFFSINLYALVGLLAGYMIDLRGYQWWQGALVILPALVAMPLAALAGILTASDANRKPRMFLGLAVMALATGALSAVDLYTSKYLQVAILAGWGVGAGLVVAPALLTVFGGMSTEHTLHCVGIFNITRALPAFVAGATLITLLTRHSDAEFDVLRQTIRYNRPVVEEAYRQPERYFTDRGSSRAEHVPQAHALLTQWVQANARAFAFQGIFQLLALTTAAALPLVLLVRRGDGNSQLAARRSASSSLTGA